MVAQQYNLDVIANNLANVNTTAFREQRAEFQDLMYQGMRVSGTPAGSGTLPQSTQVGLGSRYASSATNLRQGSLIQTGNPFDMAIIGEGFFAVLRPDGGTAYTRDGSFKVDSNGLLVTNDGYPLQPEITIPAGATSVNVGTDGTVSGVLPGASEPSVIGNIQVTLFTNPAGLTRIGQNLYQAGIGSGTPQEVTPGTEGSGAIQGDHLEGSNVQVVEEMIRMIMAQRAYEINSKAIQTSDEMLSMLNNLKR